MHGRSQRGFNLIELVTVLAIIAVVAAVAMPMYWRAGQRLVRNRCLANVRQIGLAFELFALDHQGRYPTPPTSSPAGPFPLGCGFPLLSIYTKDMSIFYCPANHALRPERDWTGTRMAGYAWWARYSSGAERSTVAGVAKSDLDASNTALASDVVVTPPGRPGIAHPYTSHQSGTIDGGFVLFNDGHAKWRDYRRMQLRLSGTMELDWYF